MKVLLVGASGFIGSSIGASLLADGYGLRAAGRDLAYGRRILPDAQWIACDLRLMAEPGDWGPLLEGIDVVVNASGALQDGLRDDLALVQHRAIGALAEASAAAGMGRFVQISAAGAGAQGGAFMQTKVQAEAALMKAGVPYTILRPGLVIGRNCFGGSELLRVAAAMPLAGIEISGTGPIQCVALSDVVAAVRRAIGEPQSAAGSFDLVERPSHSLAEVIACHRRWLGLPAPRFTLRIPLALLWPLTRAADALGWLGWRSPLRSNAVAALVHGIRGNASDTAALLGREPATLAETLAGFGPAGKADRWHARLAGLYPLALAALFVLWLAGGMVGLARPDEASAILVKGGVPVGLALMLVLAGSLADLAIAAGLLFRSTLRAALAGGIFLALGYAIGATMFRPDLWLDPLGAMIKVVPVVMLSLICFSLGEER